MHHKELLAEFRPQRHQDYDLFRQAGFHRVAKAVGYSQGAVSAYLNGYGPRSGVLATRLLNLAKRLRRELAEAAQAGEVGGHDG